VTYDDLLAFPDDGLRHELIDGEHYVAPAPNLKHQIVSMRLSVAIGSFVELHDSGLFLAARCDVVFSPTNVVEPDLLFLSRERSGLAAEQNIQGAPDLVIEILSPSTRNRDQGVKRRLYERMGVQEYWIADPAGETVSVYRRAGEVFWVAAELSHKAGDVLSTPLLPGLKITLARIFA